jgi:glycosyltransferase involved in cell wall biosynthesis
VDEFFLKHENGGERIREKYHLNGYTTVGYLGSIEFWLSMNPLLESIKYLAKENNIKLFLVGGRLRTKTTFLVQKKIRTLGIMDNVVWVKNFVPYHDVPNYIAAMDICTIPFNFKHPTAYYSSPNKLLEYLALKKPVISTPLPDTVNQAQGFIDTATTTKEYSQIIGNFIKNPEVYKQKAIKAEKLILKRTWTNISKNYEKVLINIKNRQ